MSRVTAWSRLGVSTVISCLAALVVAGMLASPARAEDSDRTRFYLGLRGQDTNPLTGAHDAWGASLGVNINKFFGVELSADTFERFLKRQPFGTIGELGVVALVPQVRVRYPLLHDRLVPYVLGGVGVGLLEFNDRKPPAFGLAVDTDSTMLVGTVGAGIEYFVADNVAVGVELKYLFGDDPTVRVQGVSRETSMDSLLTFVGLRLFYPELRPAPLAESLDRIPTRIYLGIRAGGAIPIQSRPFPGLNEKYEPPAYGSTLNQFFGAAVGANFGRYWGVELAAEGYEIRLEQPGVGSISEYAVHAVVPQLRLRYPVLDGLVVPYALAGVGIGYAELNDRKPPGANLRTDGESFGLAATAGAGVEYFVTSNISFSAESKYLFSRLHTIQIDGGPKREGNLDAFVVSAGLRVYLVNLGR